MMIRAFATAIFLLLNGAVAAQAQNVLQIDYGWRDDGKWACTDLQLVVAPWRSAACMDPAGDLERFVQTMDMQFANDPICHGIKLVRFPWGPVAYQAAEEPPNDCCFLSFSLPMQAESEP